MTNKEIFGDYFKKVIEDLARVNAKVPVSKFRVDVDEQQARLFGPDWFQYMIYGRGPGKQPPPDSMVKWVENNPDVLQSARATFKNISEKSLAFLIGRKIGREGTDVWSGKRKGLPFLESLEENMPLFLRELVKNEAVKVQTSFHKAINIRN